MPDDAGGRGFEIHFSSVDANVHGDVTCLLVNGNIAFLVGRISNTSNDAIPVGSWVRWAAQDNGEGSNATGPDLVTRYVTSPPNAVFTVPCPYVVPLSTEWTNGNVQIR